ncbi:4a-hydroxytetrahydrobiopterin dehydratase [Algirhabdus cladophorae]|uniref:4a-hydroxytetrahydrobiopterin dehydratase n=1 Tax=Algirhabdus cladophorae TaxID=3377108 RepID=UPI003B8478E7
MKTVLGHADRAALLPRLGVNGWDYESDPTAITKTFRFSNFREAFAWMTQAAFWAEKMDHHPEWSNVYGEVTVRLTTHSAGGVTELDVDLAQRLDAI